MPTVIVTAIRDFEFGGQDYAPGDPVVCRPAEAAAFKYRGWVTLTPRRNSRAKYHTRDMVSASIAEPEPVPVPVPRRRRRRAAAEPVAE